MLIRIPQILLLFAAAFIFVSCSGSSGTPAYNPDVGPFDEDGNYVEAWADNPPKRGSKLRNTPSTTKPKTIQPKPTPAPRVVSRPTPTPVPIVKVTPPPAPRPVVKIPAPAPRVIPTIVAPRPVVTQPKPVVAKPKTTRHVVRKGDTLFGLARKYGTTVSAIKRANGISGTRIITGRSYVIPR